MIVVRRDTPGVSVIRGMTVFGYTDGPHGGHGEVVFDAAQCPPRT